MCCVGDSLSGVRHVPERAHLRKRSASNASSFTERELGKASAILSLRTLRYIACTPGRGKVCRESISRADGGMPSKCHTHLQAPRNARLVRWARGLAG